MGVREELERIKKKIHKIFDENNLNYAFRNNNAITVIYYYSLLQYQFEFK